MFDSVYQGRRVLVTGHTGFKGSWLCAFLHTLGAELCGISLAPETSPSHWELLDIPMRSEIGDIRDREFLRQIMGDFQPEIIFHLAAQPIVRYSYEVPVETFETNLMGTVNLLDVCRYIPTLRSVVVVTSDKCYENREQSAGYTESDPMGGYDPYSASKGCAELAASSYRRSFFNPDGYGLTHQVLIATARAGNVIGGGDWAKDRLVPDIMRAAAAKTPAIIRNPFATRPWQHVLEPLSGYLQLGAKLFQGDVSAASPWNFGPRNDGVTDVKTACIRLQNCWEDIAFEFPELPGQVHEAQKLTLDCTKAEKYLYWHSVLTADEMFSFTARWYRKFYLAGQCLTLEQLTAYIELAKERRLPWTD
ncbi:MAG: CDP-glucose 4,6-dehydratase [Lentisphaerae bacterium]|nr:CDP-glucose 4,6-dehydratase [Lentisphaerota bacterium]